MRIDEAYNYIKSSEENNNLIQNHMEFSQDSLNLLTMSGTKETKELDKFIYEEFEKLKNQEANYINLAQKLGIPFEELVIELNQDVLKVRQSIGRVQNDIKESELSIKNEKLGNNNTIDIKEMLDGVDFGREISKEIPVIRETYDKQAMIEIKRNLYIRVQAVIREEKIKLLEEQKTIIQNSEITFWERMFGKEKLKNEQIRFIDLQIKNLIEQSMEEKESYSIRDILVDIELFLETKKDNTQTENMQELEENIYKVFTYIKKEEIKQIMKVKNSQNKNLPIIANEKIGLFQIKKKQRELMIQNDKIENDLSTQSGRINYLKSLDRQNTVTTLKERLQVMAGIIKDKERIMQEKENYS